MKDRKIKREMKIEEIMEKRKKTKRLNEEIRKMNKDSTKPPPVKASFHPHKSKSEERTNGQSKSVIKPSFLNISQSSI